MTIELPDRKPWPQYQCLTCYDTGKVFLPVTMNADREREQRRVRCPEEHHSWN